jgi:hypothetical protein
LLLSAAIAISCDNGKKTTYTIRWVVLGEFENDTIEMTFMDRDDHSNNYNFTLIPGKTKKISVTKGSSYVGYGYPYGKQVIIYRTPEFADNDDMFEIYLYDPKVEWRDGCYVMEKRDGVEAYFVDYFSSGKVYTIVSADNVLTITEEKEFEGVDAVLEMIKTEDFCFHNELAVMVNPDVPLGGYIVKSKRDDKYIRLFTWQGF